MNYLDEYYKMLQEKKKKKDAVSVQASNSPTSSILFKHSAPTSSDLLTNRENASGRGSLSTNKGRNSDNEYSKMGKAFSELDENDLLKSIAQYERDANNAIDKVTEEKARKEMNLLTGKLALKRKVNSDLQKLTSSQKQTYLYYLGKDLESGTSSANSYIKSISNEEDSEDGSGMRFLQGSGLFDDGYDFGDITRTILGTAGDAATNVVKGGFRFAECIADRFAHGAANIADMTGNSAYADALRESAGDSFTDKAFAGADDLFGGASVLGRTSDAILEGVGQAGAMYAGGYVLGPAGLGLGPLGTTAATTGLSYLSGTGHGINEAYQAGATDAEAQIYGRISGFADAVSELLFGGLGKGANALGISKGLSSADDMLAKTVSKLFKGQLGKNLAEFGVKAGAEGLEEVIAGSMQALGKKMTYLSEEDIRDIFADENLLEQFVVGSITSGIMQAGDVKTSTKAGRDFITNLTKNEQLVVDAEFSNRLQEATKDGKKLSKKQQNKLYEDVISDMDKGLISTDTIEGALGGEAYKGYKSATEQETSLKKKQAALNKEIETLLDKPNPTIRDNERLAAARQELVTVEKSLSGLDVAGARSALSREIIGLTKNDSRLHESFNESARRGQDLQLDVEKFTGSARTTAENLLKGGLNNTYKSRTLADLLTRISKDKNVVFDVSTAEKLATAGLGVEGRTVNGVTTKDGIILNIESVKSLNSIVGHEITHTMEKAGHYDDLAKVMKEYAELKGDYQKKRSYLESVYAKMDANGNILKDENGNTVWIRDDVNIDAEVTADLVGDYLFTDEDFIRNLSAKHQNLFQKVYAEIKYLLKAATAGSTEARKLEKVKKMFDKAYRESTEAQKNTTEDGDVRYSLDIKHSDGSVEVLPDARDLTKDQAIHYLYQAKTGVLRRDTYIPVRKDTPQIIIDTLAQVNENIANLSMVMKVKKAQDAMATANPGRQTRKYGDNIRKHGLTPEQIFEIIENLDNPSMVIYQTNRRGKGGERLPNNVAVFVEYNKGGNEGLAVIEFENPRDTDVIGTELGEVNYHTVVTVFEPDVERDGLPYDHAEDLLSNSNNYEIPIKRRQAEGSATGEIHPNTSNELPYNNSIRNLNGEVNTDFSLSTPNKDISPTGNFNIHGWDIADIDAPIRDDINVGKNATAQKPHISLEDYANNESPVWRNVAYDDNATKAKITQETHDAMTLSGEVVQVSDDVQSKVDKSFPDLRNMKKKDRTPILKEAIHTLKNNIRQFLSGLSNHSFEFEVNGKVLDAKLYSTGINEALEKVTREKANMLYSTAEIFQNARYLYSTPDYDGDPNVYRWNYFYTPVQIGEDVVGVRIAVRDMVKGTDSALPESQIYNWGIKKDVSLDGGSRGPKVDSSGVSSDTSKVIIEDEHPGVKRDVGFTESQSQEDLPTGSDRIAPAQESDEDIIKTVRDRLNAKITNSTEELAQTELLRDWVKASYDNKIAKLQAEYDAKKNKDTKVAVGIKNRIERLRRISADIDADIQKRISDIESRIGRTAERLQSPAKKDILEVRYERINSQLEADKAALAQDYAGRKENAQKAVADKNAYISDMAQSLYRELQGLRKGVRASDSLGYLLDHGYSWNELRRALIDVKQFPNSTVNPESATESVVREVINSEYENRLLEVENLDSEYQQEVEQLEVEAEKQREYARKEVEKVRRQELHNQIINNIKSVFEQNGMDFDEVLDNASRMGTLAINDTTPQRVNEKIFGWQEGHVLNDLLFNKVALNETDKIKWHNAQVKKIRALSEKYHIKPRSDESRAAQMYAEGFWVNENNEIIPYGDAELAKDFPEVSVQNNIKGLAKDPVVRQIYDEALSLINASRAQNAYPEIPRLENYFLHFRAMSDTFSQLGLPFNPNDIKAKDLPTDINGRTADNKPGQPYFASSKHREGKRTSFDLLGGLENYLGGAGNQIFHISDIQNVRAVWGYLADRYGQAHGLENLSSLELEEQAEHIQKVYDGHLSNYARFLNEYANNLAGKTALMDRSVEGIIGRRGLQVLDTINTQTGRNQVGYSISSALTNFIPSMEAVGRLPIQDTIKALAQQTANVFREDKDGFVENNPALIRRRGADKFSKTPYEKISDAGYVLMGAVDNITSEFIVRAKYNELVRKGMDSDQAHIRAGEWAMRVMGDRSMGQMPLLYNSKTLGLFTKYQLEVRNVLDSQFYDTIQEAKASTKDIENALARNAKAAAKITSKLFTISLLNHIFGQVFNRIAGYNPAFDIISTISTLFGWDDWDDEEDEKDTFTQNLWQAWEELLGDLPYTSLITDGGRIPMSDALPISQLATGKDQYGNEISRWETIGETLPYYLLPGGYGQIKKTIKGLGMFSEEHPISGSYTDKGNLRFPVEKTFGNVLQAGLFGQYANKNARDYFDNERSPLKEKQIQEFIDVDLPIADYWKYREGLAKQDTLEEKFDYIADLDLPVAKKNILINNIVDRKEPVDMTDYEDYSSLDEFDFAIKNPGKYAIAEAIGGYKSYTKYTDAISNIQADKDKNGKSISGSRKKKVTAYIESLPLDYGTKIILHKSEYPSDDTYNMDIVEYLDSRDDISYDEMVAILKELGFTVNGQRISWN